jgi:hypothetical protein
LRLKEKSIAEKRELTEKERTQRDADVYQLELEKIKLFEEMHERANYIESQG